MISQNSFSAAGSIESKLTANRKVARPLQGTPLETIGYGKRSFRRC